jgi:hypothetical protein
MVTPSQGMAPPAQPLTADLDCEGSWSCDAPSCILSFTRTQAQSGDGDPCPQEPVCACTAASDTQATNVSKPAGLPTVAVVFVSAAGVVALCLGCTCMRVQSGRRLSSVGIDQGAMSKSKRLPERPAANEIAPGRPVQVYSKSKGIWCQGKVVRLVDHEAVEVAYRLKPREKERSKKISVDSEHLRWVWGTQGP